MLRSSARSRRLCDTEVVTDSRRPESRPDVTPFALTADDIAGATGGRIIRRSSREIRQAAVDSRLVVQGNLFVALPGERTDGHLFLGDAVAAGAAALLVREGLEAEAALSALGPAIADVSIVAVPDTLRGLQAVAAAWRSRFSPLVVGVTGSIAKTSTKEAIAAVLSQQFVTLKSEGNANNEVGLPLSVLRLGPEHEAAVLEMGMYVGRASAAAMPLRPPRASSSRRFRRRARRSSMRTIRASPEWRVGPRAGRSHTDSRPTRMCEPRKLPLPVWTE